MVMLNVLSHQIRTLQNSVDHIECQLRELKRERGLVSEMVVPSDEEQSSSEEEMSESEEETDSCENDSITDFKIGDRVKFTDDHKMVGNIVKVTNFSVWIKIRGKTFCKRKHKVFLV